MIIDFRMRPPARGFLNIGVYDNVERTAKLTECFSLKQAPSVTQKSPELMLQEMDEAGVTMGVIPGRNGHFKGTISNDDIIKLLDLGKIELDDAGNLKTSIDELVKPIKEQKPYLFVEEKPAGSEGKATVKGVKPADPGNGGEMKPDLSKMTYSEFAAYVAEHPDAI